MTEIGLDSTERNTTVARATTCERCAMLEQLLTKAEDHITELGQHRAGLELQLRRAGSAELALRRELEQHREQDPKSKQIRQILDYWQRKLNHPKAKTPLTGKRAKVVRNALRIGFEPAQLMQAIDGLAKLPYVGAGGRKATGQPHERHDDIELALRDEAVIERFIRYATNPAPPRKHQTSEPAVPRLLARLENVKPAGQGQWTARCPAHDDRHASLSVAQGRKGAVANCHVGCTHDQIVEAVGIPTSEWFDDDAPVSVLARPPVPLPSETQIAKWQDRLNASDSLLTRLAELKCWDRDTVKRLGLGWDGSRVVFPVRDERGELQSAAFYLPGGKPKMLGLHGHPRGLFPAPEMIVAPDLWIVEGEPDAVTGQTLGLPAVGLPGVNGWRAGWAPRFDDRNVVICFDCDKPGRDAAERVMSGLNGRAAQVRVVDLDASREDGYDITDAALEGVTAPVLLAMAASAAPDRTLRLIA